jgi:hypothetical protein
VRRMQLLALARSPPPRPLPRGAFGDAGGFAMRRVQLALARRLSRRKEQVRRVYCTRFRASRSELPYDAYAYVRPLCASETEPLMAVRGQW